MKPTSEELHAMRMKKFEDHTLAERHGIKQLYMHLSALSPVTRRSHAVRHGQLFTADEVRAFWADPANIDGCCCSVTAVLVDDEGKPIVPGIQQRARDTYERMKARGYAWSEPDAPSKSD